MRRRRLMLALLFTASAALPGAAAGQIPARARQTFPPLMPHARLRVATSADVILTGELASMTADTMILLLDGSRAQRIIPSHAVRRLEVSQGMHSHVGRGALLGFVIGAAAAAGGVAIYCATGGCEDIGDVSIDFTPFLFLAGGVGVALVGTGVGALIGSNKHEHWRELRL